LTIVYIIFGKNSEQIFISLSPNRQKTLLISVLKQAVDKIRHHTKQEIESVTLVLRNRMSGNIKERPEGVEEHIESQI